MAVILVLLRRLNEHEVEFVLIGGLAANLHGVQRVTEDIAVCVGLSRTYGLRSHYDALKLLSLTSRPGRPWYGFPTTCRGLEVRAEPRHKRI
jgi:hypothetical protein